MTGAAPQALRTPRTGGEALRRGLAGHCPCCGAAPLFDGFLRPLRQCRLCGQDLTGHAADDFPPYVAILITGHAMAPVMIGLVLATDWPTWVIMALCLTIALAMMLGLLRPAKGAIIAWQWWLGLHGFAAAPGKAHPGALIGDAPVLPAP